jgi:isoquinoline 1-oxidoreductase subunit beta
MTVRKLTRRDFLRAGIAASAAGGLLLGLEPVLPRRAAAAKAAAFAPSAFVQIGTDDVVTIWVTKSEMGQGPLTTLSAILADELEADWNRIVAKQAHYDPRFGEQMTGGSTAVRTLFEPLRRAGAAAREMLVAAAAQKWRVEPSACRAQNGAVHHAASKRRLSFGALAAAAAKLPVPKSPTPKSPADFRLIGKSLARRDAREKIEGTGRFGIDVRPPGLLFASVARCPVFGGKTKSFDATRAKAVKGVKAVVQIGRGVAVVAESTHAALKGRETLTVTWDEGKTAAESSKGLRKQFDQILGKPMKAFRTEGDVARALAGTVKKIEATYELPFAAHATMEPMNATADVRKDRCEIWVPTQSPQSAHEAAVRLTGLPGDKVKVNVTLLGGGFGRRAMPDSVEEAVEVSKQVGKPVQVLSTREDDLQHDYYRPASLHHLRGGVDAKGWPVAWHHRYTATPIASSLWPDTKTPEMMELGGAVDLPYLVPNLKVEFAPARSGVPRGWLRSVAHTYTAFVVESFLDELAHIGGKDPLELRRHLLRERRKIPYPGPRPLFNDTARAKAVLELAAKKAGWGKPLPRGVGRGIAQHFSFHSYAAEVVEASVEKDGRVRVHRVVCAIDCGRVVNPDLIAAQMEGAVALSLTMALKDAITIEKGRVVQKNFDDYDLLRFDEMPRVEVHLMPSTEAPTGVGEPGVPPTAPALGNALFAATGKRVRRLPIRREDLR